MELVSLDRIVANPYQRRQQYGDVEQLGAQIAAAHDTYPATLGLMQVPAGRIILDGQPIDPLPYGGVVAALQDEPDALLQLAFGHRRAAAFRWLLATNELYRAGVMPVSVAVLDDAQMLDAVWSENADRLDTSPVEDARLMQVAREELGLGQKELGERWNLSRSAVANKLRLLTLPAAVRDSVDVGALSERQALALKTALDWPAELREEIGANEFVDIALSGTSAERLRSMINQQLDNDTILIADMSHRTTELEGEGIRSATCGDCPFTLKGKRCWSALCHNARRAAYSEHAISSASAETGIPIDDGGYWNVDAYDRGPDEYREVGRAAVAAKSSCLVLIHAPSWARADIISPDGWPEIAIACSGGHDCECKAEYRKSRAMTPEQLAAKQERDEIEARRALVKAELFDPARELIRAALRPHITDTVVTIVIAASYHYSSLDSSPDGVAQLAARNIARACEVAANPHTGLAAKRDAYLEQLAQFDIIIDLPEIEEEEPIAEPA